MGTPSEGHVGADSPAPEDDDRLLSRLIEEFTPDRETRVVELSITVILAIAAVLTAWAGLQSAKWSGEQAIHFSEAGANRTESTRFDNRGTSAVLLDTQTFLQWGLAVQNEAIAAQELGVEPADPTTYDPNNPSVAGYFFSQFRKEFRPRVLAWLEGGGPQNPEGASPFAPFDEYLEQSVPAFSESARLSDVADEKAEEARQDNQNSDDYVVTVVVLASVLFFAGVAGKMSTRINRNLVFVLAVVMLAWGIVRLATLPIHPIP